MKRLRVWSMWQRCAAVMVAAAALAGCGGSGGAAASKAASGTVQTTNGVTAAQVSVAAPEGVTLTIPANTTLTDATGGAVSGAVTSTVSYSSSAADLPAAASTIPAGTTLAGFAEIGIGAVKYFSQPVSLSLKVAGASAGDTLEVYSFDSTKWQYEGQQVVTAEGRVSTPVRHLSLWGAFKSSAPHPAPPAGLLAVAGDEAVTVTWNAVAGATSYQLYYGTSAGVTVSTGTKAAAVSTTSQIVSSLANGTPYYFMVTASNATGESLASAEVAATPIPAKPTGITLTAGDSQVAVSWTTLPNRTYNVYYSSVAGLTKANGTKVENVTMPATVKNLTNNTLYYFGVSTVSNGIESELSSVKPATPAAALQPPTSNPANVNAVGGAGSATITWDPMVDISSYNVYYVQAATIPTMQTVKGTGVKVPNATSPQVVTLPAGSYWFIVTAVNPAGEGPGQNKPKQAVVTAGG